MAGEHDIWQHSVRGARVQEGKEDAGRDGREINNHEVSRY